MRVTFTNIESIHRLLTTTDWIDEHDPVKRLAKREQELKDTTDNTEKDKINRAITGLQATINSGKKFIPTIGKLQIQNEAPILLANLHLLYDKQYNIQACEQLKQLLKDNFAQLKSVEIEQEAEIKEATVPHYVVVPANIVKDPDLYKRYEQLLPYCNIIAKMYFSHGDLDATNMATKLSTYFLTVEDAKNYLKTVDYSSKETIELSFQYNLPPSISGESLQFWQKLNSYVPMLGRKSLQLFSNAHLLKNDEKFLELLKSEEINSLLSDETHKKFFKKADKLSKDQKEIKEELSKLVTELEKSIIPKCYKYDEQELPEKFIPTIKDLTDVAFKVKLDNESFQAALNFIKEGKLKTEDKMPDISFNFEVKGKTYYFNKLPPNDMRGFVLGKLSDSCQSIGGDAEKCVLNGMGKAEAGFYIITDVNGKIRAQSYGWLGGKPASSLVLDSFEYLGDEDESLFVPAMKQLTKELAQSSLDLYVGTGGQTPEISVNVQPRANPTSSNLKMYGDSKMVYKISEEIDQLSVSTLSKNPADTTTKTKYKSFSDFKNHHKAVQGKKFFSTIESILSLETSEFVVDLLNESGLKAEEVVKMFFKQDNTTKIDFFSEQSYGVMLLVRCGTPITEISQIYDQNHYDQNHDEVKYLIKNSYKIVELNKAGLSWQDLSKMLNNPKQRDQAEYLIENSYKILNLKKAGLSWQDLSAMLNNPNPKQRDDAKYLIKNSGDIVELNEAGLSWQDLSAMLNNPKQRDQAEYLIDRSEDIYNLNEAGLSWQDLSAMLNNPNPKQRDDAKYLIKNNYKILNLNEAGLSWQDLSKIFDQDRDKGKYLIENSENILRLNEAGLSWQNLSKIFDQDCDNTKYLIENSENILRLNKTGLSWQNLSKMLNNPKQRDDAKYLIKNNYKILNLNEAGLSWQDLSKIFDQDRDKGKYFLDRSWDIYNLNKAGLFWQDLSKIFDQDPKKAEFLIQNTRNILNLNKTGVYWQSKMNRFNLKSTSLSWQELSKIFDQDCDKAKYLIENSENILRLHKTGLSWQELSKIFDQDRDKAKYLIENSENILNLKSTSLSWQELSKIFDQDRDKGKYFLDRSWDIYNLNKAGLFWQDLSKIFDQDPKKAEFLIQNTRNILNLNKTGVYWQSKMNRFNLKSTSLSWQELSKIFDQDPKKAEFLIKNTRNILNLKKAGLSWQDLSAMLNNLKQRDQAEYLIKNSRNILNLKKAGLSWQDLSKIFDQDCDKAKLLVENYSDVADLLRHSEKEQLLKVEDFQNCNFDLLNKLLTKKISVEDFKVLLDIKSTISSHQGAVISGDQFYSPQSSFLKRTHQETLGEKNR